MKNILIACTFLLSTIASAQSTWYEIPTGTISKLNSIDFPSNNVGYIVGADTTILKTTNGGQTWEALALNGIFISSGDDFFSDVRFIDENIGFLVSGYSGVWKTVDGAQSWTQVQYNMCFPHSVFPFNDVDYLIGGGDCFAGAKIDEVVNSVANPASISADFWFNDEIVLEMSFSGSNRGLAVIRNEYVLRTIDSGSIWDTISTGIEGVLTSVVMVDDTLCYAGYQGATSPNGILKSTDGGLTWDFDPNLGTVAQFTMPDYLSVCSAQSGDVYSGAFSTNGLNGLIFETSDGVIWNYATVDQPINDMTSIGLDVTFGVGDSGYLVVNTPIAELGTFVVADLDFSVYPNPVQNELTIENPGAEMMEVVILDASGRLLKTHSILSESTKIDCSDLNNGMYFIQVTINDRIGMKQFVKSD